MQLILHTTVLVLCVLSALALPNLSNHLAYEPSVESFKVQLHAAQIDTRAMTTAEANCAITYNNRNQKINSSMIAQINKCFETAVQTTINNNRTSNSTVMAIRKNIAAIQINLNSCSELQENTNYLTCITLGYDNNMQLLDNSNAQAYQVMAQIKAYQIQVDTVRQTCTNAAILQSKAEMTQCANEYNICLNRILR